MVHRRTLRFPVHFRNTLYGAPGVIGDGYVVDLSLRGCRIQSEAVVPAGAELTVHIYEPKESAPIVVHLAVLRWTRNRELGVEFLQLRSTDEERLLAVIRELETWPPPQRISNGQ